VEIHAERDLFVMIGSNRDKHDLPSFDAADSKFA
jgi:hypothetical protein